MESWRTRANHIRRRHAGDAVKVAPAQGRINEQDIAGEIGEVIAGKKRAARARGRSPRSTPPGSRCRIPPPSGSGTSGRWRRG
jgi:hypothetical protein